MAGLLDGVLPWVYSRGNALNRGVTGLLSDPLGSMEQTAGLLADYRREDDRLNKLVFADSKTVSKPERDRALNQLANRMLSGPLSFAPAGITAWHGSPHTFTKFDSSKIGNGEGAQAYGHGMYFAESPEVAKQYQKQVSSDYLTTKTGELFQPSTLKHLNVRSMAARGDLDGAIAKAQAAAAGNSPVAALAADDLRQLNRLKAAGGATPATGNVYKVDIDDNAVARMLDWDKPVSQQSPEVKKALAGFYPPHMTGQQIYEEWAAESVRVRGAGANHNEYAANLARQFGIPGARYLDEGSRGAGKGTSNFVVFPGEDAAVKTLERNGVPLR